MKLNQILGANMSQDIIEDKTPISPGFPITLVQAVMEQFLVTLESIGKEVERHASRR